MIMSPLTAKYPRGVFVMFFIQLISMIGFSFVMYLLVLYCTKGLHYTDSHAYSLNGAYIALMYAVHVVGGYVAERYLGYRRSVTIGIVISTLGLFALWIPNSLFLLLGLSAFIVGSGLLIPCLFVLLGRLYPSHSTQRDTGFVLAYVGMNVGSFFACALAGPLQERYGFNMVFLIGALSQIVLLVYFLIYQNVFNEISANASNQQVIVKSKADQIKGHFLNFLSFIALAVLLNFSSLCNVMLIVFGIASVFFVIYLAQKEKGFARKNMYAFLIFTLIALCFWSLYMLSASALTIFTDRNVDRHLLSWLIPTASFSSLNPFFIMTLGPFVGSLWFAFRKYLNWNVSLAAKFSGGLILVGLGFLILVLGIQSHAGLAMTSLWWIVLSYFIQTLGELLVGPAGFSMVGTLVPARMEAFMVGVWELSSGLAGTISGYLADATEAPAHASLLATNHLYAHQFMLFGSVVLGIGVLVAMCAPLLTQLTQHEENIEPPMMGLAVNEESH